MLRKLVKISPRITVGPQPGLELLEQLASKGFKSVLNLSKKGELGQLLDPSEEQLAVAEHGLEYSHFPLSLSTIKDTQIKEVCALIDSLPTPIYIHCRIGQRCAPLAIIYHGVRKKLNSEQVMQKASKLGLEFSAPMISKLIVNYLDKLSKEANPA